MTNGVNTIASGVVRKCQYGYGFIYVRFSFSQSYLVMYCTSFGSKTIGCRPLIWASDNWTMYSDTTYFHCPGSAKFQAKCLPRYLFNWQCLIVSGVFLHRKMWFILKLWVQRLMDIQWPISEASEGFLASRIFSTCGLSVKLSAWKKAWVNQPEGTFFSCLRGGDYLAVFQVVWDLGG